MKPKNWYSILANHQAFGLVEFRFLAENERDAFNAFKQIVFNARQWIVKSNEPLPAVCGSPAAPTS